MKCSTKRNDLWVQGWLAESYTSVIGKSAGGERTLIRKLTQQLLPASSTPDCQGSIPAPITHPGGRRVTVDNADVPFLIEVPYGNGRSLLGGHDADRPPAVHTVQVGIPVQVPLAHCLYTRSRHAQSFSHPVLAVRFIPPLHHRWLGGRSREVAAKQSRLKQHGHLLLLRHSDLQPFHLS